MKKPKQRGGFNLFGLDFPGSKSDFYNRVDKKLKQNGGSLKKKRQKQRGGNFWRKKRRRGWLLPNSYKKKKQHGGFFGLGNLIHAAGGKKPSQRHVY